MTRSLSAIRRRPVLAVVLILFIGTLINLPALRSSFLLDDYIHAAMVDGKFPAHRSPFDLYNFVDDGNRGTLIDRGLLPWWSHPKLTIRFFRPLSSILLFADHRLLGNSPIALHLHSLLWWMAAVLAARALFRRVLAERAALIATIVFALAPCHSLPLAWLANREALISLTFGALALRAHIAFREEGSVRAALSAAALFASALLAGEYALCFGGYVLALELFGPRAEGRARSIVDRGLGVLPFAIPAAGYLLVRAKLRYGTRGSGFYADPFRESLVFLEKVPRRLVTLIAKGWFSLDVDALDAETPWWAIALLAAGGVVIFVLMLRAFARVEEERRRTASWALLGSALAVAPVLAVMPSPRLLGISVLGIAIVVAILLDHAWFPGEETSGELARFLALVFGFAHFVHAPVTTWLVGRNFHKSAADFADHAASFRAQIEDPAAAQVTVVRGMGSAFFLPFALDDQGTPPARWRILAQASHALILRRGPRTIDVVMPKDQSLFPAGAGYLFRGEQAKFFPGEVFNVPGMRATILDVGPDGPRQVRYDFDRDLESAQVLWVDERADGLHALDLPEVGFGVPSNY